MNVRLRTRYLDDSLTSSSPMAAVRSSFSAPVSTRAERKRSDGVAYFEIDDASTVDFKRQRLAERGVDAPITFIAGNYVTSGVLRCSRPMASTATSRPFSFGRAIRCI